MRAKVGCWISAGAASGAGAAVNGTILRAAWAMAIPFEEDHPNPGQANTRFPNKVKRYGYLTKPWCAGTRLPVGPITPRSVPDPYGRHRSLPSVLVMFYC